MFRRLFVLLVAVSMLAGCSGGDEAPIVSFDGEAATYSGPEVFSEMPATFTLENPTTQMVGFGWSLLGDESVTLEDGVAWYETHQGDSYEIPSWVADYGGLTETNFMNDTREVSASLPDGEVLLWVWVHSDSIIYPAARVTVDTG